ncbi:DUF58 domain-containing protein [Neobacillus piezotolerans]|uniref:DUF58 domain-containing protein n=1 Tax=Neobacillus piezotolerans TaxID=2259171 RepID=A0A3D8GWG9_9BACI|nr:DUF58 domain-containing protein [Neobacillus piezotolerans]RDU38549.1 DUF58 domain-containing protein [Neobacillus piezotolerans]
MSAGQDGLLARLQRKRLSVKTRRRAAHKGGRRSGRPGQSLEFSDFRAYQPGDDIRLIDWNLYGRTGKHYIKRFLDEQEIHVAIFLDASPSMRTIDTKWRMAKEIAAALSYIVLMGEDRLSFIPASSSAEGKITRKGTVYAKSVYKSILATDGMAKAGTFTENALREGLKSTQTAIVISDGLENPGEFDTLFRKLALSKIEVKFIQILSGEELFPSEAGDLRLIDSETGTAVDVTMRESIIKMYQRRLKAHNASLEQLCSKYGFSYLAVSDRDDFHEFIFQKCTAKKVLE